MASQTLNSLPARPTPAATDQTYLAVGGADYRATLEAIVTAGMGDGTGVREAIGLPAQTLFTSATCISDADLSRGSTETGTDQTAALQALLDKALDGPLNLIWDGAYGCTGLDIHSNTCITVLPSCGAILHPYSDRPLLANANPTYGSRPDKHITINGGRWHGNGEVQTTWTAQNGYITALKFLGVEWLIFKDVTIIKPRTFASHVGNVWHYINDNPTVDVVIPDGFNFDGHKVHGPSQFITFRNYVAKTIDDAISLCTSDGRGQPIGGENDGKSSYLPVGGPGDITDVDIDGVTFDDSHFGIRLLAPQYRLDRVSIRNVRGVTTYQWLLIDNYSEAPWLMGPPGEGNIGTVTVDNTHVSIRVAGYKDGHIYVNTKVDCLKITNCHRSNFTDPTPTLRVDGEANVGQLIIDDMSANPIEVTDSTEDVGMQIRVAGRVQSMIVRNSSFHNARMATSTRPIQVMAGGRVEQLTLSDNICTGFPGLLTAATGTVGISNEVNTFSNTIPSAWILDPGIVESRMDYGFLDITPVIGDTVVARSTGNDTYSGNVMVSALVNYTTSFGANRGCALFARGDAVETWPGTCYAFWVTRGTPDTAVLYKCTGSTVALATSPSVVLANDTQYRFILRVSGAGPVTITGQIQRASDGWFLNSSGVWVENISSAGANYLMASDSTSPITGAGKTGVAVYSSTSLNIVAIRNFRVRANTWPL